MVLSALRRVLPHGADDARTRTHQGSAEFRSNGTVDATKMSKDGKVITRGRFKGKKITFASTERIEDFTRLADDFMEQVFEIESGEYLITDESDVLDFTEMGSSDTSEIWKRIEGIYGVALADVGSGRLVDIFTEIARRRNLQ